MYNGGLFRGHKFTAESNPDGPQYSFAVAWGKVIADSIIEMHSKRVTKFTLKYHNKNFLNVVLWGESPAANVAAALEKGDMVLCFGTITEKEFISQRGEHRGEKRTYVDLTAQIVIPMSIVEFAVSMFANDGIKKLMAKADASIEEDSFESAGEFENMEIPEDCPF